MRLAFAAIGLVDTNTDDPQSSGDYAAVLLLSAACGGAAVACAFLRRSSGIAWFADLITAGIALISAPTRRAVGAGLLLAGVAIAVGEEPGFALAAIAWSFLALVLARAEREVHVETP